MCFDPVTLGLTAAGSALSGYEQMQNNNAAMRNYRNDSIARVQQMQQDAAEATLRNKILGQYVDRQKAGRPRTRRTWPAQRPSLAPTNRHRPWPMPPASAPTR